MNKVCPVSVPALTLLALQILKIVEVLKISKVIKIARSALPNFIEKLTRNHFVGIECAWNLLTFGVGFAFGLRTLRF